MHQCLKCKKTYEDEQVPIIDGCECGGRMFLIVKEEGDIQRAEGIYEELTEKIGEIKEVKESKPESRKEKEKGFGVETIRVKSPGVYEINLQALMGGRPVIVLSKGGSYIISLPSAFTGATDLPSK
jgi:predicted  nucleic acid-binding Zn-ribbon protein